MNLVRYKSVLFLLALIVPFSINAQTSKKIKISGSVIEQSSGNALQRANVSLLKSKDSAVVSGDITDKQGKFTIANVPEGEYIVKANYIGFNPYFTQVQVKSGAKDINLGKITLSEGAAMLDEVMVTAERSVMELGNGKKVFNVEKNLSVSGGTAIDVMKNIPSVNVDEEGTVSLRGSTNLNIMINGKPSSLTTGTNALEQISAGSIEKIEVITNPSAKYEAEGMTGIINIVLKKEDRSGLNGLVSLNAGTKSKYNGSLSLNYSTGDWNFYGSYDYGNRKGGMEGHSERQTTINGVTSIFLQQTERHPKFLSNNYRFGFDYTMTDADNITAVANIRDGSRDFNMATTNSLYSSSNVLEQYYKRPGNEKSDDMAMDYTFNYKHSFADKGHELTADFVYSKGDDDEDITTNRYFYDTDKNLLALFPISMKSYNISKNEDYAFQTDYVLPISDKSKIETGVKYTVDQEHGDYDQHNLDSATNTWILDQSMVDKYTFDRQVVAIYAIYSGGFGEFSYSLGLRGENTVTKFTQRVMNKAYNNDYFDLFPSLSMSYKLTSSDEVQLNYSRRINRPNTWYLNPFVDNGDPNSLRYGNPNLDPEYINSYEINYVKTFSKLSVTPTVFYRQTDNIISRFSEAISADVIGQTFKNMDKGYSYGLELNMSTDFLQWMRLNGDFSYYRSVIEGSSESLDLQNDDYSWNTRLNASIIPMRDLSFQFIGSYNGPTVMAQGKRDASWSLDFATRYDMFDRKLTLTFRVSDLFDSMKHSGSSNGVTGGTAFANDFYFKRQSQVAMIGISYKINEGQKKSKAKNILDENGGGGEDF